MKISLIQMDSKDNKEENFQKAMKFLEIAVQDKANIVCLSERFLYWGDDKLEEAENQDSKYIKGFQEFAKNNNINIILGSVSLKDGNEDKTTNTSLIINRKGEIIHRYDKIYMFNVCRDNLVIKESGSTISGDSLGIFELDGVKIGIGICYDLRYPEYFQSLAKKGVEIIFLPANFRKTTGKIAWDILTQARAIENQVYFCACGQTGGIEEKERCGNSRIVSFDGEIIKNIEKDEGVITAELDLEALRKFRKEFPVLEQIKDFN